MKNKFAIFDFDGTLVDSMRMWESVGFEFLDKYGIKYNRDELFREVEKLTLSGAAKLFEKTFSLDMSAKQINDELNSIVVEHYKNDIPLKTGIKEHLESLTAEGVRMCIASATDEALIIPCAKRLGIFKYFEFVLSCENMGVSKTEPEIYFEAARRFNAEPSEISVYEDMAYTIETAKRAGFYTIGVYDKQAKEKWDEICSLANEVLKI